MKKFLSLALCALMLLTLAPMAAYANGEVVAEYLPVEDFFDNEELFAAYVDREFYPEYEISLWGTTARAELNAKGQKLYDSLKSNIEKIAKGTQASAVIEISSAMLQQWGVTYKFSTSTHNSNSAMESVDTELQSKAVITALLHDCPYDFYWFDKTEGWGHGASTSTGGGYVTITSYVISFSVAQAYQPAGYNASQPTANTAKTGATSAAVANANAIVEKYKALSDYEKIKKYKEEICALVSYNDEAAADPNPVYGDPWQMIYVFDKNDSTNVVCEGYSKAFQYLCDRSTFNDSDVACYTVSGVTQYNGSQGGHMWNIVTMDDGKNYIADITNSDNGAVGQGGGLFLAGMSGNINTFYKMFSSKYMYYAYYDDTKSFWGTDSGSILNITSADYNYTPSHVCSPKDNVWHNDADFHWQECSCGEEVNVNLHDAGVWRTTKEPQIGVYGEMELHCTVCDRLLGIEMIPPRQPDHACAPKDTLWNSNSTSHWQVCSCSELINQALHDNGIWVTVTQAQIGTEGKKELRCTVCQYVLKEETIPALEDNTQPDPDPNPNVIVGDVNGNGKIDARDYLLLKRAYFGTFTLQCELAVADINGNGKIDARDYLLLKRAYFGTYTIK